MISIPKEFFDEGPDPAEEGDSSTANTSSAEAAAWEAVAALTLVRSTTSFFSAARSHEAPIDEVIVLSAPSQPAPTFGGRLKLELQRTRQGQLGGSARMGSQTFIQKYDIKEVPHPDAMTLSLDICGPFRPGEDCHKKARYFMVGVFTIPVRKREGEVTSLPLALEEQLGEEKPDDVLEPDDLLPRQEEEEVEKKEGDGKPLEEWLRLEVEAEDIEIQNYTLVETLPSRQGGEVKAALARMVARLKYLGLDVRRVHSDAATEMKSTRRWCEDRGLYRTFTSGSDWKANGRAEAEIGVIRRAVNTLIRSAGEGEEYWPLMAKHVGERRGRQQLALLGYKTPQLMPWGQKVMVTTKGWDDFQGHWRARKKAGVIRGPDPDMSLTSGGHLVEVEKGKFVRTDDMATTADPPALDDVVIVKERPEPASILDKTVKPPRRLTEKTALARIGAEEIQQRLIRGQQWANQEFKRLEIDLKEEGDIAFVDQLDTENAMLETYVMNTEVAMRKVEAEAILAESEQEEVFLQTRTISLNEVKRTLPLWIPPLRDEIANFDSNQAIQRVSEKEAKVLVQEAEERVVPGEEAKICRTASQQPTFRRTADQLRELLLKPGRESLLEMYSDDVAEFSVPVGGEDEVLELRYIRWLNLTG
eukprot:g28092.t1